MTAWRNLTWWIGVGVFAVVGLAVAIAGQWDIEGRLFPWVVGIPLLFVAALQLVLQFITSGRATPWTEQHRERVNVEVLYTRIKLFAWVVALLALMALVGHLVAVPLFLLVFMINHGERLWVAALAALIMWAFIFFMLGELMRVHLPTPYLVQWAADWGFLN